MEEGRETDRPSDTLGGKVVKVNIYASQGAF